ITTEECLLGHVQQRNPALSRDQIEKALHDYLAVTNVIWLERGIVGDDTHGHVDDITRFVNPSTVVTAVERNGSDPNAGILAANPSGAWGQSTARRSNSLPARYSGRDDPRAISPYRAQLCWS